MEGLTRGAGQLSKYIDHTLLKPDAPSLDYEKLCQEAIAYGFYSVCIPPARVTFAQKILKGTSVKICTVIGFPFGYNSLHSKSFEAKTAVEHGAHELDMVLNISALKSGDKSQVLEDIRSVVRSASGCPVKVIFETCYLTDEEKYLACDLSVEAGASFIKTSTGFGPHGATEKDVRLMVERVAGRVSVKASGGIRDYETALKYIQLGATRLGTSQGVAIATQATSAIGSAY